MPLDKFSVDTSQVTAFSAEVRRANNTFEKQQRKSQGVVAEKLESWTRDRMLRQPHNRLTRLVATENDSVKVTKQGDSATVTLDARRGRGGVNAAVLGVEFGSHRYAQFDDYNPVVWSSGFPVRGGYYLHETMRKRWDDVRELFAEPLDRWLKEVSR